MPRRKALTSDIVLNQQVTGPRLSPDGSQLMFAKSRFDMQEDKATSVLCISSADGSNVREFAENAVYSRYQWAPDGHSVAYLKLVDKQAQLFIASLAGGEPKQMTSRGVSDFSWAPESTRLVVVRTLPDETEQSAREKNAPAVINNRLYKFDGAGLLTKRQHLFVLNIDTGKEKQITRGDWNCNNPCWSPDGKFICFVSNRHRLRWDNVKDRTALWLVSSSGGKASRITPETGAASPRYSPDGKLIAYIGLLEETTTSTEKQANLIIADSKGKGQKAVTDSQDMFVMTSQPAVDSLVWRDDSKKLWFTGIYHGAAQLYELGVSRGTIRQLSHGDQSVDGFAVSADRVWLSSSWLDRLQEIHISTLDNWKPKPLTTVNAALTKALQLGRSRRVTYKAPDGLAIEGFLVFPPAYKKGNARPLIMNVHGGPHGYHPVTFNPLAIQAKAAAGYVMFLPNPRGSITYGDDFMRRVVGAWGEEDFEDLMAGIDHLVKQGIAHPDKLYLEGYSYGGFMSSWIVGRDHRFRAAVIGAPLTDMTSAWSSSDLNIYLGEQLLGTPHDDGELFREKSPLSYARQVQTPCLLVHWAGDTRCPVGQSEAFYLALKTLKKKTSFILYPGGSHGNRTPSQIQDFAERALSWFKQYR